MSENSQNDPVRSLLTVRQFAQKYQAFSQGGLRWMIFNSKASGLDTAIVRIGRRILLDEDKFFEWVDACNARNMQRTGGVGWKSAAPRAESKPYPQRHMR